MCLLPCLSSPQDWAPKFFISRTSGWLGQRSGTQMPPSPGCLPGPQPEGCLPSPGTLAPPTKKPYHIIHVSFFIGSISVSFLVYCLSSPIGHQPQGGDLAQNRAWYTVGTQVRRQFPAPSKDLQVAEGTQACWSCQHVSGHLISALPRP